MKDDILVIEGVPHIRKQLVADLAEDYEVTAVPNYLEGLSALKRLNPEMVIVNVSLPLIDGWEACRELSRDFGLPVMLLGKNGGDAGWEKAFDAGADFYLKTPFSKLEILSRIKAILRRTCRSNHPPLPRRYRLPNLIPAKKPCRHQR